MVQFDIRDAGRQQFSVIIDQRRVTILLSFNHVANRWFFDLALDGEFVLHGRKVITGVDLIRNFGFGVGGIIAYSPNGNQPTRQSFINGESGLYSVTQDEINEAIRA